MNVEWVENAVNEKVSCLLCKDGNHKKKILTVNRDNHNLNLYFCGECGSYFFYPPYTVEYSERGKSLESRLSLLRYNIEYSVDYLLTIFPLLVVEGYLEELNKKSEVRPKFLDIGSGAGVALMYAKYYFNFDVYGIEPAKYGELAGEYLKVPVFSGYLEDFQTKEKFDVIVSMQVIEHIPKPIDFLKIVKNLMSENGILIMTTPHSDTISKEGDAGKLLAALSPGEHMIIYNEKSMSYLLEQAGFTNYKILRDFVGDLLVFAFYNDKESIEPFLKMELFDINQALARFISISENIIERLNQTSPYYLGLLYRLFKYKVSAGKYIQALKLIFDVRNELFGHKAINNAKKAIHTSNINTLEDWGKFFPFSYHGFLFYRGFIDLNFYSDYEKACSLFELSHQLCNLWLSKYISADLETPHIFYASKYHEALSYYHANMFEHAERLFNEFIKLVEEKPDYIRINPPEQLVSSAKEFVKSIREKGLVQLDKNTGIDCTQILSFIFKSLMKREIDETTLEFYKSLCKKEGLENSINIMIENLIRGPYSDEFYINNYLYIPTNKSEFVYVFLHINKTGGMSLNLMLKEALGEDKVSFIIQDLKIIPLKLLEKFDVIDTHDAFDSVMQFINKKLKIFTVLRDPYDRLISLYRFPRSFDPKKHPNPIVQLANKCDLYEFYKNDDMRQHYANEMSKIIMGRKITQNWFREYYNLPYNERSSFIDSVVAPQIKQRLEDFFMILLLEDFEFGVKMLFNVMNLEIREIKSVNVTDELYKMGGLVKKEPTPKYTVTDEFKLLVEDLVVFDRKLYEIGKDIYQQRKNMFLNGDLSFASRFIDNMLDLEVGDEET